MDSARHRRQIRRARRCGVAIGAVAVVGMVASIGASANTSPTKRDKPPKTTNTVLVMDNDSITPRVFDPLLLNPWGLALGPDTPAWVADNGSDVSTLYTGFTTDFKVKKVPLDVSIPGGAPTGAVFNGSSSFGISAGGDSGPANFLFDSEAGKITAWSQNVPPANKARVVKSVPGAVFKGLAIGTTAKGRERLYATDFHGGRVDVFNGQFEMVHHHGAFRDRMIPDDYAPFGIQNVRGRIFVTYAKQDADGEDDLKGPHHGFVDIYSTTGKLLDRFIRRGSLNSPWGIARAPKGWAGVGRDILIGNFGDGYINVFDHKTGRDVGTISSFRGIVRRIEGLWALRFGNGVFGTHRTLLYTSGPFNENHGLLGALRPVK